MFKMILYFKFRDFNFTLICHLIFLLVFLIVNVQSQSSTDTTTGIKGSGASANANELQQIIVLEGRVDHEVTGSVNQSIEYVYEFNINRTVSPSNGDIRVHVSVVESELFSGYPVMFVVRQQRRVISWELPTVSKNNKRYYEASRTLCTESDSLNDLEQIIYVSVATLSPSNIPFSINVSIEQNFVLRLDEKHSTEVSPTSPRFYQFVFPTAQSKFVLLEVTSNSTTCMTVSVQNSSCPIMDQESNINFQGYWQTMSTKAGMTLRKSDFPLGFYVVFVVHSDDTYCTKDDHFILLMNEDSQLQNTRKKGIDFVLHEKISDMEYITAIFGTVGIFLLFYVFSIVISVVFLCKKSESDFPDGPLDDFLDQNNQNPSSSSRHHIVNNEETPSSSTNHLIEKVEERMSAIDENAIFEDEVATFEINRNRNRNLGDSQSIDSSLDETDFDTLDDAQKCKDVFRTNTSICVSDMARKNHRILAKKSQLYLWTLLTVAIFYALPVVQLVFTYQKVLHTTGNQDLCFYNYLCAHPLWFFSDFNHVYSNIGYIMLGILFLSLVLRKDSMHKKLMVKYPILETHYGIPHHFGLFYAMGVALIMEGVLSASYHVCPNHSNFQFDTCFMYVNAILCILKIYQSRHPDINASAYMTFTSLAFVVLITVLGVVANSPYYWIAFTVFHLCFCYFLSIQIYYLGRWHLDIGIFQRIYQNWRNDCLAGPLYCLRPLYIDRMILLSLANISNWGIAGWGLYKQYDFASHLLLIFMSNLVLYTSFYIVMKLTHREKILWQPMIYIVLQTSFWGLSLFVFLHRSTSWHLSPAESRAYNRECMLLRFYDTHDIWHFLSASSMFFSFMLLLTLDDDLATKPRNKIAVF